MKNLSMKTSEELRNNLRSINHKSYPAYKSLTGSYSFGKYILNIEHVQGDPFAAPSRLSVEVNHKIASFLHLIMKQNGIKLLWKII